jgi:hypothetical protein
LGELLSRPVAVLNLSARASNCLDAAKVASLRDLVTKTEADLLRVRSFGKTSLHEVQRKLSEVGLALGMKFGGYESSVEGIEGTEPDLGDPDAAEIVSSDPLSGRLPSIDRVRGPASPVRTESNSMEVFTMGD